MIKKFTLIAGNSKNERIIGGEHLTISLFEKYSCCIKKIKTLKLMKINNRIANSLYHIIKEKIFLNILK